MSSLSRLKDFNDMFKDHLILSKVFKVFTSYLEDCSANEKQKETTFAKEKFIKSTVCDYTELLVQKFADKEILLPYYVKYVKDYIDESFYKLPSLHERDKSFTLTPTWDLDKTSELTQKYINDTKEILVTLKMATTYTEIFACINKVDNCVKECLVVYNSALITSENKTDEDKEVEEYTVKKNEVVESINSCISRCKDLAANIKKIDVNLYAVCETAVEASVANLKNYLFCIDDVKDINSLAVVEKVSELIYSNLTKICDQNKSEYLTEEHIVNDNWLVKAWKWLIFGPTEDDKDKKD